MRETNNEEERPGKVLAAENSDLEREPPRQAIFLCYSVTCETGKTNRGSGKKAKP